MRRAAQQNQWLKAVLHKRTVNLACRLIVAMPLPRIGASRSGRRQRKRLGGHRYQIPGRRAHCALRPRGPRVRNDHHPSGDPDRAISGFIRRYRAPKAAARRKWRPPARAAALTKILIAATPRRLSAAADLFPIAIESGRLRQPAPVVPSASGQVRAPKRAER